CAAASRRATEVWVHAPALSTTGTAASAASCSQPLISCSASVWRTSRSMPRSAATRWHPATRSAYVVVPYTSGSRCPRRPRLGPFSTKTVIRSLSPTGPATRWPLRVSELVQPGVVDPEVVCDLVRDRDRDLGDHLVL